MLKLNYLEGVILIKMTNAPLPQKKPSWKAGFLWMILLACALFLSVEVSSFSLSKVNIDESLKEGLNISDSANKYPAIEITSNLNLPLISNKVADLVLTEHTESCGSDCVSSGQMTTYKDMPIFDKINFYTIKEDGSRVLQPIRNYKVQISTEEINNVVDDYEYICKDTGKISENKTAIQECSNELVGSHIEKEKVWIDYTEGEEVKEGTYFYKVSGEKKAERIVDWVPVIDGKEVDELSIWGGIAYNYSYLLTNIGKYYKLDSMSNSSTADVTNSISLTMNNVYSGYIGIQNYSINGTTSQYLYNSGSTSATGLTTGNHERSVNFWFYATDWGSGTYKAACFGFGADSNSQKWNAGLTNSGTVFRSDFGSDEKYVSITAPSLNNWHMVTVVYTTNKVVKLYIDGAYVNSVTHNSASNLQNGAFYWNVWNYNHFNNLAGQYDEIGFWDKSLNESEISDLYQSGIGITYPFAISRSFIAINSPLNNSYLNNSLVNFNITTSIGEGANATNITLYLNGIENETKIITGATNTTIFTRNLPEGSYNQSYIACDTDGDCGNSSTYYFTIDYSAPTINITSPTFENYLYQNKTLDLNYSITDATSSLSACWYIYNNQTKYLNCSLTNTTFNYSVGQNSIQVYANDSLNNIANVNQSWGYYVIENNIGYNSSSIISKDEYFVLNLTTAELLTTNVYLVYDGISYYSTPSGNKYTNKLSMTSVGNKTFYWNITYGTSNIQTRNFSQYVSDLSSMIVTSGTCPVGTNKVIYFDYKDEQILNSLKQVNANYNFKFGIANSTISSNYGSITSDNISICMNTSQSLTYLIGYGQIDYSKDGYSKRSFYVFDSTRVSNETTNNTLYLLNSSSSTSFSITAQEPTLNPLSNYYSSLIKWFPELNEYKVVEMGKTDSKGQYVNKINIEDTSYRVGIYSTNGSLFYLNDPIQFVCLTSPCTYTLTTYSTSSYESNDIFGIQGNLSYNNGAFTYIYNDPSQKTSMMIMNVYKIGTVTSDSLICSSNSTSFTGVLYCNVNSTDGSVRAEITRYASPGFILSSLTIDTVNSVFKSSFGLFIQFIFLVVLGFAGIFSPVLAIILAIISLSISVFAFHSISITLLIGTIVLAGLVINFMRRNT